VKSPLCFSILVVASVFSCCCLSANAGDFPDADAPAAATSEFMIPGPLRSFLRMAGISQKITPEEVLPLLSRNVYMQGYEGTSRQTEFLILLSRYVVQTRELAGLAATDVATMEQEIETSLWQERLLAALSSVFAALSALIAAIGLFGMLAYAVSRRRREIGIRMAVGATIQRIAKMIVRDAACTVLPGILCGIAVYAACARILVPLLYGVTQWNAVSFVGAAALVIAVSIFATLLPVLNAAQVQPWEVLREE